MNPTETDRHTGPDAATAVRAAQVPDQLAFLADWLPPAPARILDAGCGPGHLALALGRAGYAVTAVDTDPEAVTAASGLGVDAVEADISRYEDDPFDAVLFSLSLHHMTDLAAAVERARALLRPGGILVVDEFAWERADVATASWFYDMATVLTRSGRLTPGTGDDPSGAPYPRWVSRHRDELRLHPGTRVIGAVAEVFDIRTVTRVPYLYRYLGYRLIDDRLGVPVFTALSHIERLRIADGGLAAVGLRLLGQPRQ
ncbi:class I SAM-dependent methyltransferase [Plantactinospora soyae]|uniref:SAM-dependent methyltransferase n=1 Tax=Plantactinospora soyae TaxID=1544732 RepID=A0A927R331_9ACTN|nr:class I SAM-dependent methyltransferase [Plantactinospora soyae]MBE1491413.1 SAM-dependent methyltransferase [Plantactinospora soyae]